MNFLRSARLLGCLPLLLASTSFAQYLANIDNTWSVLPVELRAQYSFTNGAIAWETGFLNNFHRFSNFFPVTSVDRRGRTVVSYDPGLTDNMTKLMYVLFYRVPGSTSYADFSSTDLIKQKNPHEVAKLIAHLVVGLDHLRNDDRQEIKNEFLAEREEFVQELQTLKNTPALTKDERQRAQKHLNVLKQLDGAIKKYEKTNDIRVLENFYKTYFSQKEGNKKILSFDNEAKLREKFKEFYKKEQNHWSHHAKQLLHLNPDKFLKISPTEFTKIVIGALHESSPDNPEQLYPEYMVHTILLGFLYKVLEKLSPDAAINRHAIKMYYDTLAELLHEKIELPLVVDLPVTIEHAVAENTLKTFFKSETVHENLITQLDSFFFYVIKLRLFPHLIGYETTSYQPHAGAKAIAFPDCMENSIANFIRMMAYDTQSNNYLLSTLESRLNITLKEHKAVLNAFLKNPFDHDAWTALVSNAPYVPYLQAIDQTGNTIIAKGSAGFMRVADDASEEQKQAYRDKGYDVITIADGFCFELRPSVRTIIMILNYVLDLDLFEDIAQEAFRSDFVAHYFPLLCKKLTSKGRCKIKNNSADKGDTNKIDVLDLHGDSLISVVPVVIDALGNQLLKNIFSTSKKHGEYSYEGMNQIVGMTLLRELSGKTYRALINDSKLGLGGPLAVVNLWGGYDVTNFRFTIENSKTGYVSLFAFPLYNPDFSYYFLDHIKSLPEHPYMGGMLFKLCLMQPDFTRKIRSTKNLFLSALKSDQLLARMIEGYINNNKGDALARAITKASELIARAQAGENVQVELRNLLFDPFAHEQIINFLKSSIDHNEHHELLIYFAKKTDFIKNALNPSELMFVMNLFFADSKQYTEKPDYLAKFVQPNGILRYLAKAKVYQQLTPSEQQQLKNITLGLLQDILQHKLTPKAIIGVLLLVNKLSLHVLLNEKTLVSILTQNPSMQMVKALTHFFASYAPSEFMQGLLINFISETISPRTTEADGGAISDGDVRKLLRLFTTIAKHNPAHKSITDELLDTLENLASKVEGLDRKLSQSVQEIREQRKNLEAKGSKIS